MVGVRRETWLELGHWQFDGDFIVYDMKEQNWVEPLRDALIPRAN